MTNMRRMTKEDSSSNLNVLEAKSRKKKVARVPLKSLSNLLTNNKMITLERCLVLFQILSIISILLIGLINQTVTFSMLVLSLFGGLVALLNLIRAVVLYSRFDKKLDVKDGNIKEMNNGKK